MKKSDLIKGILGILLSVVLIGSTFVFAADTEGNPDDFLLDLSGSESGGTQENKAENNVVNNVVNNNVNKVNNAVNNVNKSIYNNKNTLSDAGLADSMPVMVLVVVFGISAIYAYKKINDYKKF